MYSSKSVITHADQTSEAEKALQRQKFEEIVGVLLSAGYFRARIATLTPFDKVVGGMCWCLTSFGAEVDVDIFYSENPNLGQKIQLSENIVKVLRSMLCPHPLQANQIQGSDFAAMYPVIQWLVTKVIENREATGDTVRKASESNFRRSFFGAVPPTVRESTPTDAAATQALPNRQYRRTPAMWGATLTPDARMKLCLLEYGEKTSARTHVTAGVPAAAQSAPASGFAAAAAAVSAAFGAAPAKPQADSAVAEDAEAAEAEQRLLGQMTGATGVSVSGSNVGKILGLEGDAIRKVTSEYKQREDTLRAATESGEYLASSKMGKVQAHRRRVNALRRKLAEVEAVKAVAEEELTAVKSRVDTSTAAHKKTIAYNNRVASAIAKATADAGASDKQAELTKLRDLIALNESLKQQEAQFKAACGRQRGQLKETEAALRAAQDSEESKRLGEIERRHGEMLKQYTRLKAYLAVKNQEMAQVGRMIDDVPSRSELIQYERRFVELYEQVSDKLDETRKHFSTYNALDQKRTYIHKEESLVTSISGSFANAMKTKATRQQFLDQCGNLLTQLQNTLASEKQKLEAEVKKRDAMTTEQQKLIDSQRAYFRAIKLFQEECDKNEALHAQVSAARK